MKSILLIASLILGLLIQSSPASITFNASPSAQSVAAGGTFNVSLTLTVTGAVGDPANVTAFDLYLVTAAINSGFFRITSAVGNGAFTALGPTEPGGGDPLSTAAAGGFVRNGVDQGFSATSAQTTPLTNALLETLTLSVAAGVAPGVYTFSTSTSANAGAFFSDVSDSNGMIYQGGPATFQITVVPEPSTWAFLGLGALGCLSVVLRRRTAA